MCEEPDPRIGIFTALVLTFPDIILLRFASPDLLMVRMNDLGTLYAANESFFELQVWNRTGLVRATATGLQPEPTLIFDAYHPSAARPALDFKLLRVSLSKAGPFFTIQGNKGLKVHDLCLICILQIGSKLFVSRPTSFPSSESRRAALSSSDDSHSAPPSPADPPRLHTSERTKALSPRIALSSSETAWEEWSALLSQHMASSYLPKLASAIQQKSMSPQCFKIETF